jgi:hypothetical protein
MKAEKTAYFIYCILVFVMVTCVTGCSDNTDRDADFDLMIGSFNYELSVVMDNAQNLSKALSGAYANASSYVPSIDKSGYRMFENGIFYSADHDINVSVIASGYFPINDSVKEVAYLTQAVDPLLVSIVSENPFVIQAWYLSKESVCRLSPAMSRHEVVPGSDLTDYLFYNLAAPYKNFGRTKVWTKEPYVDPAGRGWMISALAPVYYNDQFCGVAGVDIAVENMIEQYIPAAIKSRIIVIDSRGGTVWSGIQAGKVFGIPELRDHKYFEMIYQDTFRSDDYSILKSRKRAVRKLARAILNSDKGFFELESDGESYSLFVQKISSLDWTIIEVDKGQ